MSLSSPDHALVGSLGLACTLLQSRTPQGMSESQFQLNPVGQAEGPVLHKFMHQASSNVLRVIQDFFTYWPLSYL